MRKTSALIALILVTLSVRCQSEETVLQHARKLVELKQYNSAYVFLDSIDPHNAVPELALFKADICLDYFVSSIMHQIFALKDLEESEDVYDYRGKEGVYSLHAFSIDSTLTHLIQENPENCGLYKGLGKFYYEVYDKYGGNWLISESELIDNKIRYLSKADNLGCADYNSSFILGMGHLIQGNYPEGIKHFNKSIKMNDNYAASHYNLAIAFMQTADPMSGINHAEKAVELYDDIEYKSDAARVAGYLYIDINDFLNAIPFFEMANKIDPDNYYNMKPLLSLYVETKNEKASDLTKRFYELAPDNPTIYDDLNGIYHSEQGQTFLNSFLNAQFDNFADNYHVLGNINFSLAKMHMGKDNENARDYFMQAKYQFSKVFENNHPVFSVIEEGLKNCD